MVRVASRSFRLRLSTLLLNFLRSWSTLKGWSESHNESCRDLLYNAVFRFIDLISFVLTHFFKLLNFLLQLLNLSLELGDLDVSLGIANSGAHGNGRRLLCFE